MIYFGIPLRSKAVSKDWAEVTRIFNRTLKSVYNQTDPDFKIIVACHEIPVLEQAFDSRVEFIQTDTPIPANHKEMMMDKGWKLSLIAERIRQYGGGYTMIVDSDDLVSNRIAAYVKAHPKENGFLSKYGYCYNEGASHVKRLLSLHKICGSCAIVYYNLDDLPSQMPKNIWDVSIMQTCIIRMSHTEIPSYLKKKGKPLKKLPFVSTVYVRNTGNNHSMLGGNDLSKKRKIELLFRNKIAIDGVLRNEFGL